MEKTFRDIWKLSFEKGRELSGKVIGDRVGIVKYEGTADNVFIDQTCRDTFHTHIRQTKDVQEHITKFGCDLPSFNDYTSFIQKAFSCMNQYDYISDTVISEFGEAILKVENSFFTASWNDEDLPIIKKYFFWLSGLSNVGFLNKRQYLKMVHDFDLLLMSQVVLNFKELEGQNGLDQIVTGYDFNPGLISEQETKKKMNRTGLYLIIRPL